MDNLQQILESAGFSQKKAKIYLAILELGEGSVIDIAKKALIKRTTVYNILPELLAEGLVQSTSKKKKKLFFIEDPRDVKRHLKEKVETIEKALPQFEAIQNILPYKPKIKYYEGLGGMKDLYEDTLRSLEPGDTILSLTGLTDFYRLMPQDFANAYIKERIDKKIKIQVITPDSKAAQQWEKDAEKELREIRIVKNQKFAFDADTEIYGNKIALISYRENFMGVIIESKEIAQMHRLAFELMWESLGQ